MKPLLFATFLVVCSAQLSIAQTTFRHPEYMGEWGLFDDVKIERVEFTDTATVLTFRKTVKRDVKMPLNPSCYLETSDGQRHYVKGSDGVSILGSGQLSTVKDKKFTLLFPPLPDDTKFFDLHGGRMLYQFSIYGIHEKGTELKAPDIDEAEAAKALMADLEKRGTACVRGRVVEGKDSFPPLWELNFSDESDVQRQTHMSLPLVVRPDSTFEVSVPLSHPCMAALKPGLTCPAWPFMLYLFPGDTINLTVRDSGNGSIDCTYAAGTRLANMLQHFPVAQDVLMPPDKDKSLKENLAMLQQREEERMRLCDYLTTQYRLTPTESLLLRNEVRLCFLNRYSELVNSRVGEKIKTQVPASTIVNERLRRFSFDKVDEYALLQQFQPTSELFPFYSRGATLLSSYCSDLLRMAYLDTEYVSGTAPERLLQCYHHADSLLRLALDYDQPSSFVETLLLRQVLEYMQFHGKLSEKEQCLATLQRVVRSPYLQARLPELVESHCGHTERFLAQKQCENVRDTTGLSWELSLLDSIAGRHRGKYVQIISMTDPNGQLCFPKGFENLKADFSRHPDVAFVFVARAKFMTEEEFQDNCDIFYREVKEDCYRLSEQDWARLSALCGYTNLSFDHMTLNRSGQIMRGSFALDETYFRSDLRAILQEEQFGYGRYSDEFREAQSQSR